jgi:curli biogenesis system outer membrane secretion channel CsgG
MNANPCFYRILSLPSYCIFIVCLFFIYGCATTSESIKTGDHAAKQITLAVWDFDNNSPSGGEFDYLGKTLSEELLTHLSSSANIKLVEREHLRQVLEEQHLSASQLASEKTRLRLGHLAGANYMAFGSYIEMGGQIRIDVRVVDVETSQVKVSDNVNATPQDAAQKMQALAQNIAAQLGTKSSSSGNNATGIALWKLYETRG